MSDDVKVKTKTTITKTFYREVTAGDILRALGVPEEAIMYDASLGTLQDDYLSGDVFRVEWKITEEHEE